MNLNREYKELTELTQDFREERDRYMGKVKFNLTDGYNPEKTDGVIKLKAPMAVDLHADEKLSLKLGVTFSVPVLLVENPYLRKRGVSLANSGELVMAGVDPVLNLHNATDTLVDLDSGSTIVFAVPLESNFKLERE